MSTPAGHAAQPCARHAVDGAAGARPALARHDGLTPAQRRAVVGAIVVLHAAAGWALWQVPAVREAVAEAAPMFVDLLAPPATPLPLPPPPPPPPAAPPTQRVVEQMPPPPSPLVTAAPSPATAAFTAPPAVDVPAALAADGPVPPAPATPPAPVTVQAPPPAAPAPVAAPKIIPPSAVQYLEQATPVYSPASARARESGRVMTRVLIDEAGLPRTVQVHQSSRFLRLDDACVAAVRQSRFKPYTENGQPTAGWAFAPCDFEL